MSQYDTMPAGPEIDRLVAERVMGWRLDGDLCITPSGDWWDYGNPLTGIWSPSTDIAHAWGVVEKMGQKSAPMLFQSVRGEGGWWCNFNNAAMNTHGDTAPLAICRAALKAMEKETPK